MKTYALTGGATGIGAAIKARLLKAGHRVISVDIKDADIIADLSTPDGRELAINSTREIADSGLDGLITCAGLASHVPNRALITQVNYFGCIALVNGLKDLVSKKQGKILLIASNSAPGGTAEDFLNLLLDNKEDEAAHRASELEGQQVYAGTKRAVVRWMRRQVPELARMGININALAPGFTDTPMTQAVAQDPTYGEAIRQFAASIPLGRAGQPDDMADAAEFLLSDKANFITGSTLFIDGGHDAVFRPDAI
ncbi:SDR family oxidoreductase [Aestuariicella hydrocarbonica]|uniref:SDR family oxidoreductase n=1 Tax=Pseudomaricurvus hydrocarbonicus TaxID=1470433 RepID=A0A9E5MKQ8_9GAMM|nr:SDR family oxidoreductase [Aestuariicella hydrocarbonica]NHO66894.1 SDR family oxidoreductase [Aestuariicella hydrocarbonica]